MTESVSSTPSARSFTWGVSASAFQIEGARGVDGKGDSIWDRFSDQGRMPVGGETACDHYHRWEEDLDLLSDLGVDAYRFSIAWSRIIPNGDGPVNQAGLDFYRRLIGGMRDRGIEPWLTLYHWDLPVALDQRGGWLNRDVVDWFTSYTRVVVDGLGDLVSNWITHNEPWVTSFLGYRDGVFAPGIQDWGSALQAGHYLLLSHGKAVMAIKEQLPDASVGIAIDCRPAESPSNSDADAAAARHFDGFRNRWFFDPVFGEGYPEDIVDAYVAAGRVSSGLMEFVRPGDMDEIATPIDFLGLNYYTTSTISPGMEETDEPYRQPGVAQPENTTEMGWLINPGGLRDYLLHLTARYSPPSIVVTENGASYSTAPDADGIIDDVRRISYLESHVDAVLEARRLGAPVDGYFVWSLLDNLEWTSGFSQRFGLVWVDFDTLERIPKQSFYWYREKVVGQQPAGLP